VYIDNTATFNISVASTNYFGPFFVASSLSSTGLSNCTAHINISIASYYAGAFMGSAFGALQLTSCSSQSNISTTSSAAGFIEDPYASVTLLNCSSNCTLKAILVGGLFGELFKLMVT